MRLRVDLIPKLPRDDNDYVGEYAPWFWYGKRPCMGDRLTWADAPLGSKYWCISAGQVTEWLKVADNKVMADWQEAGSGGTPLHDPVTLGPGSDPALALAGQELTLTLPAGHNAVTLGAGSDPALTLAGQQLTLADVLTPAEHTAIGNSSPHHAPVTLGAGSDAALTLSGQQLTLADVLTPAEHSAIGDGSPHHAPVTLSATADTLLGLGGQQVTLDNQTANRVLAGPTTGSPAAPTFRALVAADIPALDHGALTGLADDDHTQYLNTSRHDTTARHGAAVVDHGSIGGLSDDDHTQYVTRAPSSSARNVVQPTAATAVPLTAQGASGQTANLTEWKASAGNVMAYMAPDGLLFAQYATINTRLLLNNAPQIGAAPFVMRQYAGNLGMFVTDAAEGTPRQINIGFDTSLSYAQFEAIQQGVAYLPIVLQPVFGNIGIADTTPTAHLSVKGAYADIVQLALIGYSGQTLALQEWRNSAGSVLAAVTAAGGLVVNEAGNDADTRIESDNYDALVVDASDDALKLMANAAGKLAFFGVTPVTRQTELTDELPTITYTSPTTPDYALQNLTAGGYGFATRDEGNSVLAVIANLQARVNELETKLAAYGLLPDSD